MPPILLPLTLGPWPMNAYLVVCADTRASAIIDPGADADTILQDAQGTQVEKILITHAHEDHIGALEAVREATSAPVYLHPADAQAFNVRYDFPLRHEDLIRIGQIELKTYHTPGHTPGSTCIDLQDGRVLVGDALFVGGPGYSDSPLDFSTTMRTLQEIIFRWPDETEFFTGHGPSGVIGKERPALEAFLKRGWPTDLHGDVTWSG